MHGLFCLQTLIHMESGISVVEVSSIIHLTLLSLELCYFIG